MWTSWRKLLGSGLPCLPSSFAPTHCENLGYHRTVSASIKLNLVTSQVPLNSSTPGPLGKINTKCGQGWKAQVWVWVCTLPLGHCDLL